MNKIKTIYVFLIISFLIHSKQCIASVIEITDIQHVVDMIEKESEGLVGGAVAIIQNE